MSRPSDWGEVFGIDDPTPGDPFEVRRVASSWRMLAGDAEYAETKVRQLMTDDAVDGWLGEAGAAFRSQSTDLPDQLAKCADSYRLASETLSWWAGRLTTHQADADSALVKGRAAKADLEAAQAHLAVMQGSLDTASHVAALSTTPNLHPPSREQVQAAQDRFRAAQAAQAQASAAVTAAQSRLDALKQLALDAGSLREQDGKTAASRVHEAADAGIAPRHWWQKATDWIADHWDVIIEVVRVAVAVLGVVALILGGPLAWVVFGMSVLLLADALNKWREGKASGWDVLLCAIGCIPGARGLTSLSELSAAFRAGGLLGAGGHLLGAGKNAVVGLAASVRAMGPATVRAIRGFTASGLLAVSLRLGRPVAGLGEDMRSLTSIHYPNLLLDSGLDVGVADLPTSGPVARLVGGYERFGGTSPDRFSDQWSDGAGHYDWSKVTDNGFNGPSVPMELHEGERLDRFGHATGRFLSPDGTPFAERAIPPSSLDGRSVDFGYHRYEVVKPFTADVGYIAAAMGQPGGGLQVLINASHIPEGFGQQVNVQWLLDNGFLREVKTWS